MNQISKNIIVALRLCLGWLMLYAGITKVLDPEWTSAGYLAGANSLQGLFGWLASPNILPIVDFLNQWGLTFLGISLILGIFVRLSSVLGTVLMLLYYLPVLDFPYLPPHSYIVDDHIIYALLLLFFAVFRAGRYFGLDKKLGTTKFYRRWLG